MHLFLQVENATMRHTLTSFLILMAGFMSMAQVQVELAAHKEAVEVLASPNSDNTDLPYEINLSEGFVHADFDYTVDIDILDGNQLSIETDFPKTLQYSISNLEGIILRKGKIYGSAAVDLARLRPRSYAVYVFQGKKIVRALMIDMRQKAMQ